MASGERFDVAIRGILFDKDGTLIDFTSTWDPINRAAAQHAAGGNRALAERLLAHGGYDLATGRCLPGTPLAQGTSAEIARCFAQVLGADGLGDGLAEEIERIFVEGGATGSVLVEGTHATLTHLRARVPHLGIATNDSEAGIATSLQSHGVLGYFDFLVGFDSGHGAKPGPGMVEAFCRARGLEAHEVCVVGDTINDMAMGSNAGVGFKVGVLTGPSAREDLAPIADLVLDSIAEMPGSAEFLARLA